MMEKPSVNILIVDDESSVRNSMMAFFEDYDFNIKAAENAEQALELAENKHFDAAVIDLRLPGMSGEDLIVKIHETQPGIRFIIHTGSLNYHISEKLKHIGLKHHHIFTKPLPDLEVLVSAINKLLQKG